MKALRMSYIVASVGGVLFFVMSVALLGVWPARVLQEQTRNMAPENPLGLTRSELRGRAIYAREGCAYCHTQQIRYVEADMERFGAPTLAWETRLDYPHLWGTRRIGPDLSRQYQVHPADWHFAHLYSPRSVVADSVMPAFRSLFNGAPDEPAQEARDLVSYLESLGRARELAGPEGEARARERCHCPDDEMLQMGFHSAVLNANTGQARRQGPAPALRPLPADLSEHQYSLARLSFVLENGVAGTAMPAWRDFSLSDRAALAAAVRELSARGAEPAIPTATLELGARVYRENCAQCHGANGGGDGSAVGELRIVPANLHGVRPTIAQSIKVLRNGIEGTQMAVWTGRLNEAELSAVAYYVRGFYQEDAR